MRITRDRQARTITLDQELYITKAREKYGLSSCKVSATPEVVGQEAAVSSSPHHDAALDEPADSMRYMEMTGTIIYPAVSTRPDIAHAAHGCAGHMQAPTLRHMMKAERVLRYLAARPMSV